MEIDTLVRRAVDQRPGGVGHRAGRGEHRTVGTTGHGAGVQDRADDRPHHGLEPRVAAADRAGVVDRVCRTGVDVDAATGGRDRTGVDEAGERRSASPDVDAVCRGGVDQAPGGVGHGAAGRDHHGVAATDRAGVRQRADRRAIDPIEAGDRAANRAGVVEKRERLAAEEIDAIVRRAGDHRPGGVGHRTGRGEHRTVGAAA